MARSQRQANIRKIGRAVDNMYSAIKHLDVVGEQYVEDYPEQAQAIGECIILIKSTADHITEVKKLF